MHFFLTLLLAGAVMYAVLCAALFLFQARFVYFPSSYIVATPADSGLEFEEVFLTSSSGSRIAAWFVPSERELGTLLFCHGNAGNISGRLELIELFHGMGLNVFIFDYQGYGRSSGAPNEKNTYADVLASWEYLTEERKISAGRIILLGRSLGGPVAAWLARDRKPGALILESTFTSLADVAADHYPVFPARLLTRYGYNTADYLGDVSCPVLVTHSLSDRVVPFQHGKRLFERASEPKEFLEMSGTHDDGFSATGKIYVERINAFLEKHIGERREVK